MPFVLMETRVQIEFLEGLLILADANEHSAVDVAG
jgi:hypothetical protein